MKPLISVIIPVYNPGNHFRRCIESIINQTYTNLEIILIDDGSTDGSSEICDEYAGKDNRIICVHQSNKGVSIARNIGLSLMTGDYISFPDSDDFLDSNAYEYLMELMKKHNCDVINFEYYITYSNKEIEHLLTDSMYGLTSRERAHEILFIGEPFCCNKLYNAHLVSDSRFRDDIMRGEDSLFAHELIDRANRIWFDKKPLYHYVQTDESACRGVFRKSQLSALKLYDAYEPLISKYDTLKNYFYQSMCHIVITIYFDMWNDAIDYKDS